MTTSNRIFALTALLGATSLALTGCVLPIGGPDTPPTDNTNPVETETDSPETDTSDGDEASFDLAGTDWTGTVPDGGSGAQVELTFNPDGTVDFADFGGAGSIDHPSDTWDVDGTTVTVSLVYVQPDDTEYNIDFTGDLDEQRLELSEGGFGGETIVLDRA